MRMCKTRLQDEIYPSIHLRIMREANASVLPLVFRNAFIVTPLEMKNVYLGVFQALVKQS
jgi:hypothetical protein